MDTSACFGVTKTNDTISFCIGVPDANEVQLKLYPKDTKALPKVLSMNRSYWQGDVFSISINENELLDFEGYRYEALGHEFIDPYARKIVGRECFGKPAERLLGGFCEGNLESLVEQPLNYSYSDLILYELHVRGFTKSPDSGVLHKGTFLGMIEKVSYFTELGINAVLLQPCYEFNEISSIKDSCSYLPKRTKEYAMQRMYHDMTKRPGEIRINYWGYTEESYYYAPKASYAADPSHAAEEFLTMVQTLHQNGIEVWLQFCFPNDVSPSFITSCLRYWVETYHVDGFYVYASNEGKVALSSDVYLKRTKLMFDSVVTNQASNLVPAFKNIGFYHQDAQSHLRKFLRGDEGETRQIAELMKETSEAFGIIHGITSHDGFTLADLYSYDLRHNEANKEDNRDGTEYNYSMNCGAEGITKSQKVIRLRKRMIKNAMMLLFMAQATPLLLAGDEFGNSQFGNNNAYCQDNEIGWITWKQRKTNQWLFTFTKQMIAFRKEHPVLHNPNLICGKDYAFQGCPDLSFHGTKPWYPDYSLYSRNLCMLLNGAYAKFSGRRNDISCLFLSNMHQHSLSFGLVQLKDQSPWKVYMSTTDSIKEGTMIDKDFLTVEGRSVVLLVCDTERKKN